MAGICHRLDIFIQRALGHLERWGFPCLSTAFHLRRGDVQFHGVRHCVDRNRVAVFHESNWTAVLRLGNDMADTETVRSVYTPGSDSLQ